MPPGPGSALRRRQGHPGRRASQAGHRAACPSHSVLNAVAAKP